MSSKFTESAIRRRLTRRLVRLHMIIAAIALFAVGAQAPSQAAPSSTTAAAHASDTGTQFSTMSRAEVIGWLNANAADGEYAACFNNSVGYLGMKYGFSLAGHMLTFTTNMQYREVYKTGVTERLEPQSYIDRFSLNGIDHSIYINRVPDCSDDSPPKSFHWSVVLVCKSAGCINQHGETVAPKNHLEISFPSRASPEAVRAALQRLISATAK